MKGWGVGLLIVGVVAGLVAWLMPVTVETPGAAGLAGYGLALPTSVVNLGKLQVQMMIWQGALAAIIAGSVLLAGGEVRAMLSALRSERTTSAGPGAQPAAPPLDGPAAMAGQSQPEWQDKPEPGIWGPIAIGIAIVLLIVFIAYRGLPTADENAVLANAEAIADNLEATADALEAQSRNLR